ncbi:protein jag [Ectobacillus sp. JY-23]|uniref:RNA-binding cell elongation regulator Jag/EloR n=1 Tax=Ectobacillus sp. JY-23 TaxID=2933872 RepID=UPI001FF5FDB9|nr:RNA-binding cell elongation regulator Jag/EloR [Ectobacillus sp. JY-23]UOY91372.1 protein jag [Ectobacillus sp. JY-23]
MNAITAKGQTVDEAIESALRQLQVPREQVEIRVIDEGKRGFLGLIGNKPAIVDVMIKKNAADEAEKYLKNIISEMAIDVQVERESKGKEITFILSGSQVALLIGKRGATLNALQQLTQLVANRYTKQYINITLDAEDYRNKRKKTLELLANRLAKQVYTTRKQVILEPMPSFERKIIHQVLASHPHINTTSAGTEPHRHVVIEPK